MFAAAYTVLCLVLLKFIWSQSHRESGRSGAAKPISCKR